MSVRNLTKKFIDIRNGGKANRSLSKDNDSGESDSGLLNVSALWAKFVFHNIIILIYL